MLLNERCLEIYVYRYRWNIEIDIKMCLFMDVCM